MAKNLKLNRNAPRKIRTLPGTERLMNRAGEVVAQQAGSDYGLPGQFDWKTSPGDNRAAVAVFGTTYHADRAVAKHPARLIGAMRAVRRAI